MAGEETIGQDGETTRRGLVSPATGLRALLPAHTLLLVGGVLWWSCHYALLWNPAVSAAYTTAGSYDLRFLCTLGGTVVVLVLVALLARLRPGLRLADHPATYLAFALSAACSLTLIATPVLGQASRTVGLAGAALSGAGNSLVLVAYGEAHARIRRGLEPLAFAVEMAAGILLSVVISRLPLVAEMMTATVAAALAATCLFLHARASAPAPDADPAVPSPVVVDIRPGQLLVLAALTGFSYGLIRLITTDASMAAAPLGFESERLGSLLGACLLAAVFVLQRRASLFDQCLLFAVPFVATGMLLASLQGVGATVAAVINTCGFSCFFTLQWYFAAIIAERDAKQGGLTWHIALFFLVSQACQLVGALVPEQFSNASSGILVYLILAVTLFMFWRDKTRTAAGAGTGGTGTGSNAGTLERVATPTTKEAIQRERADLWERTYGLSAREVQITQLLVARTPYRQISAELAVSENTVKTHVRNVYKKVGVSSREELLAKLASER